MKRRSRHSDHIFRSAMLSSRGCRPAEFVRLDRRSVQHTIEQYEGGEQATLSNRCCSVWVSTTRWWKCSSICSPHHRLRLKCMPRHDAGMQRLKQAMSQIEMSRQRVSPLGGIRPQICPKFSGRLYLPSHVPDQALFEVAFRPCASFGLRVIHVAGVHKESQVPVVDHGRQVKVQSCCGLLWSLACPQSGRLRSSVPSERTLPEFARRPRQVRCNAKFRDMNVFVCAID